MISPERKIQRSILNRLKEKYPLAIIFHVPNGGTRDKKEAKMLKDDGVLAGVSDLIYMKDGLTVCLEVKTKTGKQLESQEAFEIACARNGIPYYVVRNYADAQKAINEAEANRKESK